MKVPRFGHLAFAGNALKAEEAEQRGLELWPANEGAPALLALEDVFVDQHVDGFAHGAGGQAVLAGQRSFGGNGLARTPAVVGDLFGELVAQALVKRQADIAGESVHGGASLL
ncbi:hypothetical protein AO263_21975 [Pseudomonas sp. NZIPFR-PS5]|nr:hypothetical protein AO263_21975 [Pseudomonas sp. NZIPFR-PS5]